MKTTDLELSTLTEIVNHAIDGIEYRKNHASIHGCDLHNSLFNEDYYIIGSYKAEEWLKANGGVFNAIGEIKEYEQSNFGEVTTDLSEPERVVNMYVYILGEIVLQESETLRGDAWDRLLTEEDFDAIISELKAIIE